MGVNRRQFLFNEIIRADPTKNTEDIFNGDIEETYHSMVNSGAIVGASTGTKGTITIKPTGDGRPGVWEYIHNDTAGYIFHLMCGSGMGAGQALIGMGIDNGGVGLFVNNKLTGLGIKIDQNNTITAASAYGMQINQMSATAPAIYVGQTAAATIAHLWVADTAASANQNYLQFTGVGGELGVIKAQGAIHWKKDIETHDGGVLRAGGNDTTQDSQIKLRNNAAEFNSFSGSTDQFWSKRISHSGQSLTFQTSDLLAGGANATNQTWATALELKNVSGNTQIALYGVAPVARAAAIASPSSDTVGTKAAIDAIRTALTGIGITL